MESPEDVKDNQFFPLKRTGHISVPLGREILVWGGYEDANSNSRYSPSDLLWFYDTLTEKWLMERTSGNFPPGTSGASAVLLDDLLYIIGGFCEETENSGGNTMEVYCFHLLSKTWKHIEISGKKPLPSDKFAAWNYKDKIFIFGGFGLNPHNNSNVYHTDNVEFVADEESYANFPRGWNNQFAVFDTKENTWTWPQFQGKRPQARAAHACAKLGDLVFICGGRHRNIRMNDLHCFDAKTMTWSGTLPISEPVPLGRSWHSLTPLTNTKLILYGGLGHNQQSLSDCWIFDTSFMHWCEIKRSSFQPRLWHTATLSIDHELIVIGGSTTNIQLYPAEYSDKVLILYIAPKPLLKMCLDAIIYYRITSWNGLPKQLEELLQIKSAR